MFDGTAWHPLHQGEIFFGARQKPHTFRNVGSKDGKVQVVIASGGMEVYPLSPVPDNPPEAPTTTVSSPLAFPIIAL
jgi:hypothetical protein